MELRVPYKILPIRGRKAERYEDIIKTMYKHLVNDLLRAPYDYGHKWKMFEKHLIRIKMLQPKYGEFRRFNDYWLEYIYIIADEFNFQFEDIYWIVQDIFYKWFWPQETFSYKWPEKELAMERWLLNKRGYIKCLKP